MSTSMISQRTTPDVFPDPDEPDTELATMFLCERQIDRAIRLARKVTTPEVVPDVLAPVFERDDV